MYDNMISFKWAFVHFELLLIDLWGGRQLKRELGDEGWELGDEGVGAGRQGVGAGKQRGGSWETKGWGLGDSGVGEK